MKNILIILSFIAFPILTFGQDAPQNTPKQTDVITVEAFKVAQETENQIAVGTYSKTDVTHLSYKKSIELISIKAYRKSLQIRVKEVINC
ncbi:hypothetical protein LX77_02185 [Gelidibacter algens]|uniref:Uncharacterized protein n=1 Tax=Gelidibacter algens TaxID=49280 RepID=A0A1A7R0T2_9FLAO|nr:hypothetical protein [Gelidibacter algens]OBX25089.1 hypothetical protein A9996_11875 [Gelidibacter algens]RAJ23026.1 hypothetical protein LX77_02185 [Gelidibacter algens]